MPAKLIALPQPRALRGTPQISNRPNRNQSYVDAAQVVDEARAVISAIFQAAKTAPPHMLEELAGSSLTCATRMLLELSICLQEENIKVRYPLRKEVRP